MRVLKYRGKIKGSFKRSQWVYGYLIGSPSGNAWICTGFFDIHYEVIPETVGVCIGLVDKFGKEIYEHDYIIHNRTSRPFSSKGKVKAVKCIVEWSDGKVSAASIEMNPAAKDNPSLFQRRPTFRAEPVDKSLKESGWGFNWSEFHDCEVVGNVHDKNNT